MSPLDLLFHVLNFLAPAALMAVLMVPLGRLVMRKQTPFAAWWIQIAANFSVCMITLWVGLWFFGRDGKMATYAALVVCAATSQWVMARGWRSH